MLVLITALWLYDFRVTIKANKIISRLFSFFLYLIVFGRQKEKGTVASET